MKFGRIVLRLFASTDGVGFLDRPMTSHFQDCYVISRKIWVSTKRPPGAYAAASVSCWSIVHSHSFVWSKKVKADIALHGNSISELRDVTSHMGSHSVTCHPTQVNAPRLTPAMQAGTRFTYTGGMEGWVDLVDLIAPRPGVEPATFRSRVRYRTVAPPGQRRQRSVVGSSHPACAHPSTNQSLSVIGEWYRGCSGCHDESFNESIAQVNHRSTNNVNKSRPPAVQQPNIRDDTDDTTASASDSRML